MEKNSLPLRRMASHPKIPSLLPLLLSKTRMTGSQKMKKKNSTGMKSMKTTILKVTIDALLLLRKVMTSTLLLPRTVTTKTLLLLRRKVTTRTPLLPKRKVMTDVPPLPRRMVRRNSSEHQYLSDVFIGSWRPASLPFYFNCNLNKMSDPSPYPLHSFLTQSL